MMTVQVIHGDTRDVLRSLPAQSVQCCVTSPPYFNLRDYGVAGQIGLEPTPDGYIAEMVAVFREVRRVLRDDGVAWLNIGDTSKGKQLLMIPSRVAIALQADGWYLRSDIIWHKPNPIPDGAKDRPTSAHEHVFLLSKRDRYFYDAAAIAEASAYLVPSNRKASGDYSQGSGRNDPGGHRSGGFVTGATRNARNVWTITPKPFKGAHFATMPIDLADRCIRAGSRIGDTVLDPFGGAATTGVAALRLGRRAILAELNPEYVTIARDRITAANAEAAAEMESMFT